MFRFKNLSLHILNFGLSEVNQRKYATFMGQIVEDFISLHFPSVL